MERRDKLAIKGYDYFTMCKIGSTWLPILAIALVICSFINMFRLLLYIIVLGVIYNKMLGLMRKKVMMINILDNSIVIDKDQIYYNDIVSYYTSKPLRDFFLIRILTKTNEKVVIYIEKDFINDIENSMMQNGVKKSRVNGDFFYQLTAFIAYLLLSFLVLLLLVIFVI